MILIFTRFSVPTEGGFRHRSESERMIDRSRWIPAWIGRRFVRLVGMKKRKSKEDIARILFRPKRMERRLFLFENLCLPSLANQKFQNFQHVVLVSTEMPSHYLQRLENLQAKFGFRIEEVKNDQTVPSVAKRVAAEVFNGSEITVTSRLDDDDALGCEFLQKVDRVSRDFSTGGIISFTNGVEMRFERQGLSVAPISKPFYALGMSYVEVGVSRPRTVFSCGNHARVAQNFDCILAADESAYIVSSHVENDSVRNDAKKPGFVRCADLDRENFAQQFGVDLDVLNRSF